MGLKMDKLSIHKHIMWSKLPKKGKNFKEKVINLVERSTKLKKN